MTDPLAITRAEAAAMLSCSPQACDRAVAAGVLPGPALHLPGTGRRRSPRWSLAALRQAVDGMDPSDDPVAADTRRLDAALDGHHAIAPPRREAPPR